MTHHFETHLYTYAYFVLDQYDNITDENRAKMRKKCLTKGHTEGELIAVEIDPLYYIQTGKFSAEPMHEPWQEQEFNEKRLERAFT